MPPRTRSRHAPQGLIADTPPQWPARLTHIAFIIAIALACARMFMLESIRSPFEPAPGGIAGPAEPGPASSLLLDLFFCIPALLILLRRIVDPTYVLRLGFSHILLGAFALWTALSILWSADRFSAMVQAANFIAAAILLWSATQLVRSWGRLRIVASIGFALLLVYTAAGLQQRLIQHPAQVRAWNDRSSGVSRWDFMRQQGLQETDFAFQQFERNLVSGDLRLFANSANTYAAGIVLMLILSAGILIQRFAHRDCIGWTIPIFLTIPPALAVLYWTHSRTALVTPILAIGLFIAIYFLRGWLSTRHKQAYFAGVIAFLLGASAIIGHGLAHNSLVIQTLTNRWYYWTGAARILDRHLLVGVGWGNFGLYYPAFRIAAATEEVKDPHNFLVRAFAELGLIGGILMVGWMLRLWWELTRPISPVSLNSPVQGNQRGIFFLAIPAILAGLVNLAFIIDPSQPSAYLATQAIERAVAILLILVGFAAGSFESLLGEKIDDRPSPWVLHAILIAIGIFLIHNLIDFSLFEPGPLCLFALLTGSALGARFPSIAGKKRNSIAAIICATAAILLFLAGAGFIWAPTLSAERHAAQADSALRAQRFAQAASHYISAREDQRWNAEYAYNAARALAWEGAPWLSVRGMIQLAIDANPRAVKYHLWQAEYELSQPQPDIPGIKSAFDSALALDPHNASLRLNYAQALEKLGDPAAALDQYRQALRDDDALPPDEPKRLPAEKRKLAEQRLQANPSTSPVSTPQKQPA